MQLTDGPVADQFTHPVEIRALMALGADLGGKLVFVLEPGGANDPGFLHAVDQGFLAIDVFAAVHRPVGDKGVRVIQRAADDGIKSARRVTTALYRLALGNFWPTEVNVFSLMSQRATTFSWETPSK